MTSEDLINKVLDDAGEWIEMSTNPEAFVLGIMATKLAQANDYIEYLERRLELYDSNKNANRAGNTRLARPKEN